MFKGVKEAENFGEFKTVRGYGPEDLPKEFILKYNKILNLPKGGGYWIWRPIILKAKLETMKDGEFLVYLDAGCKLNKSGKERFNEYINLLDKSDYGIMSFQMSGKNDCGGFHPDKTWTTDQIFRYFNISLDIEDAMSGQYCGGILVMKKNAHLLKIIDLFIKTLEHDPLMFTDQYNLLGQHAGFRDNRHDQSVFSLLRKKYGSVVIDRDESYVVPFGQGQSLKFPFWATCSKR